MASRLTLTVFKTNSNVGSDVSQLVSQVKLTGRKGSSARSLEITMIDNMYSGESKLNIDLWEGWRCIFLWDGKELFRGVIFKKTHTHDKKITYKAYDFGIYLANNKDSFSYENYTLTGVFKNVCSRFGLRYSYAYQTAYILPTVSKVKKSAWDVLCDAMSKQYQGTGNRYYIDADHDALRLMRRVDNVKQWVLEPGSNLISFSRSVSIEKTRTRFKLYSSEDVVIAQASDKSRESKIGIMQEIETTRDTLTQAQATQRANEKLKQLILKEESIKVDALGIPDIISGVAVYVIIPYLGLNKTYYVDEDTHTFKDNEHRMSLTLNRFNDSEYKK